MKQKVIIKKIINLICKVLITSFALLSIFLQSFICFTLSISSCDKPKNEIILSIIILIIVE